jgi:hypothetical protein
MLYIATRCVNRCTVAKTVVAISLQRMATVEAADLATVAVVVR